MSTQERCEFLNGVQLQLETLLESCITISQKVANTTYLDLIGDDSTRNQDGSSVFGDDEVRDFATTNEAVDKFKDAVNLLSDICHAQIEQTPVPSRMSKAPYLLGMAYENIKEAASIEERYQIRRAM